MQNSKCPFHVKQGLVSTEGELILSSICGIRSACGQDCSYAPFSNQKYKSCPRFLGQSQHANKQVVIPKDDYEFYPEVKVNSQRNDAELQ